VVSEILEKEVGKGGEGGWASSSTLPGTARIRKNGRVGQRKKLKMLGVVLEGETRGGSRGGKGGNV